MLELKEKISNLIVDSKLPLESVVFVIKDIYRDLLEVVALEEKSKTATPAEDSEPVVETVEE